MPDPKKIQYGPVISEREGVLFWKTYMEALTVWVDGNPMPVRLGASAGGAAYPEAVLDSGVPLILTSTAIANGIYGALGVGPASDGQCEHSSSPCEN